MGPVVFWKYVIVRGAGLGPARGTSWQRTIREQRKAIGLRIEKTPSLQVSLSDADWLAQTWADAVAMAVNETSLDVFPEELPWSSTEILSLTFYPE
jgi:hypothetical protein